MVCKIMLLVPMDKAWSASARAAAAAARKAGKGKMQTIGGAEGGEDAARNVDIPKAGPGGTKPHTLAVPMEKPSVPKSRDWYQAYKKMPETAKQITVGEDTPSSTTVKTHVEIVGRMAPPKNASQFSVEARERTPDYSSAMLEEKYGEKRGRASYEGMIDRVGGGTFFTVHNQIVKEKKAMMAALGKTGPVTNHHYQGLYRLYHEANARASIRAANVKKTSQDQLKDSYAEMGMHGPRSYKRT